MLSKEDIVKIENKIKEDQPLTDKETIDYYTAVLGWSEDDVKHMLAIANNNNPDVIID